MRSSFPYVLLSLVACAAPEDRAETRTAMIQDPPLSGFLLGAPVGITATSSAAIRVKLPGFAPTGRPSLPTDLPDPRFDTLVASITQGLATQQAPILAMSLGIDVIATAEEQLRGNQFEEAGIPDGTYPVIQIGPHGWYAIVFSVESGQLGADPDLAPDIGAMNGRDASLFCYVLPTSYEPPANGAAPGMQVLHTERQSVRILDPAALGLAPTDSVHGVNLHLAMYQTDLARYGRLFRRPLSPNPSVYFTLRPEFIAANAGIRQAWDLAASVPIHGTTIFVTRWDDTRWSTPVMYATRTDLGLPEAPAIDGLAIDTKLPDSTAQDDELLVSMTDTSGGLAEDQILFTRLGGPPRRVAVKKGSGYGILGRQLRAGRGIGDFCTADPWVATEVNMTVRNAPRLVDDFFVARRLQSATPPHLAISAFRVLRDGVPMVRVCTSWPYPVADVDSARVRFGRVADLTRPDQIVWEPTSITIAYANAPTWVELTLPPGGFLGQPLPPEPGTPLQAFVVQCELRAGGNVYVSPIAALRY